MKRVALALLLISISNHCFGKEDGRAFLSWYDGWGTHNVWGAGKVSGQYNRAYVLCGKTIVPVRTIYDSHETDGRQVPHEQTAEFAEARNVALLKELEAHGLECEFEQTSADEA